MPADSYVDVRDGASDVRREQERIAFDQGLTLMEQARATPQSPALALEASRYMQTLWGHLIRDLSHPANDLSDELKGNLISIGLWTIKETDAIIAGKGENWGPLIEINRTIRDGIAA
ncbi:flagellar biosynthesis regulator FlaF [Acuticoccus sp. M5D2P5]|uniref:flagellar biosynthesis regulator FlaF n=1 Tax=Acuticoccus kalidii TaxID=2910977 RepID=UPI001F3DA4E3|nr:flagellar biosynthesis regulator FlaF [Acuticoccus kalidii]MCF3932487.1 flagellar biosynthesis regulator FlaF [Acuticoccus kalidii]